MEKKVNEYIIKVMGSASIPLPLENDTDYNITADIGVYSVEDSSNQDGTFNRKYKSKLLGNTEIIPKGQSPIKAKVKGSTWSQQLRMTLLDEWRLKGTGTFDEYYEKEMSDIIRERKEEMI